MVPDLVMLDCLDFAKDPFREARAEDFVLRSDSIQFATSYLPVIRKLQNYYSSLKDQKWGGLLIVEAAFKPNEVLICFESTKCW